MLLLVLWECDITASIPNAAYASAANVRSWDLNAAMLIMLLLLLLLLLLVLLIRRWCSSAYYTITANAIAVNTTIINIIAANTTAANVMRDILLLMLINSGVLIIRYDDVYNVATANARSWDTTNTTTVNKIPMQQCL